jgi:phosphate-selective porin OprO/OprP
MKLAIGAMALTLGILLAPSLPGQEDDEQKAPPAAAPAAPPPAAPLPPDEVDPSSTIAVKEGLEIQAAHGEFVLRIGGTVQVDGRQIESELGDRSTWAIRRATFGFGGTWNGVLEYRLDTEWSSLEAGTAAFSPRRLGLHNAYVGLNLTPAVRLRVGQHKMPFESEYTHSSDRFMDFMERSWVQRIIPGRDVGLTVLGDVLGGRADYAASLVNGSTLESASKNATDSNTGKDVLAQLRVRPFARSSRKSIKRLQIGAGLTLGDSSGDPMGTVYGNETGLPVMGFEPGVVGGDRRWRWAGECYWFIGPASLKAEVSELEADLQKGASRGRLEARAFFVAASWLLTGEEKTNSRIRPKRSFAAKTRGPGSWEVALRYSGLDYDVPTTAGSPSDFLDPAIAARRVRSWACGLTWRLHLMSRVMVEYARDRLDAPVQRAPQGPAASGADAFLIRFQVDF